MSRARLGPSLRRCRVGGDAATTLSVVASAGRGYLPAVGALILVIAAAQMALLFGTGGWFPFAGPGLMAFAGIESAPSLNTIQVALVPAATIVSAWWTIRWWRRAEVV